MAWDENNYETITWDADGNPVYGGFSSQDATDILNAGNWGSSWTPDDILSIFGDGITSAGLDSMFNDPAMQQYITQVANSPTSGTSGLLGSLQSLGQSLGLSSSQLAGLTSAGLGAFLAGSGASPAGETVSKQVPWEAQQPYLKDLFAKAQGQLAGDKLMGEARDNFGSLLSGPTKNPYAGDNPYLTQSINNAQSDFMRGFQPLVNQANQQSGSFGNTGVAQTFGNEAANQLGKISTNMRFQDYANQQQLGESAVNRTANATMGANDFSFAPLQQYGSLIRGQYGGNTSTPYFNNTAGNLLGGAAAGASIYNNLFGQKAGA